MNKRRRFKAKRRRAAYAWARRIIVSQYQYTVETCRVLRLREPPFDARTVVRLQRRILARNTQ